MSLFRCTWKEFPWLQRLPDEVCASEAGPARFCSSSMLCLFSQTSAGSGARHQRFCREYTQLPDARRPCFSDYTEGKPRVHPQGAAAIRKSSPRQRTGAAGATQAAGSWIGGCLLMPFCSWIKQVYGSLHDTAVDATKVEQNHINIRDKIPALH